MIQILFSKKTEIHNWFLDTITGIICVLWSFWVYIVIFSYRRSEM